MESCSRLEGTEEGTVIQDGQVVRREKAARPGSDGQRLFLSSPLGHPEVTALPSPLSPALPSWLQRFLLALPPAGFSAQDGRALEGKFNYILIDENVSYDVSEAKSIHDIIKKNVHSSAMVCNCLLPPSVSQKPLKSEEPDGDLDDDDTTIDVEIENVRPRPQGSSPVYEYAVNEYYIDPEEPMEVTLSTEVEPNAKDFTIVGGGTESIIVSQVTNQIPQSNIFCIKEGDQLLSATIYFDNITYEDAIKILQHSESCRVEFLLKRKLGKEDREKMQSIVQLKKEKTSQDKDDSTIASEKTEENTVRRREHKKKRSKKDRLSWPKFQSLANTRFLGHRRSRSTSETNEDETLEISSKVTEANLDDDELFVTEKEKQYGQEFSGLDIHSGTTTFNQQMTGVKNREEPHDRSKEKRSLDSSVRVRVEHHDLPKTQMKKGLSLHSTISSSSRETGSLERKNLHPDVEIIIVKEKNLPSPCKVSPIQRRYERTSRENIAAAATEIPVTHLTTKEDFPQATETSEGQLEISDDDSSPTTEEPSGIKQRRNKKKKKLGKSTELLQQQKRTRESSFSIGMDKEHYKDTYETQFKTEKLENVSTDFTLLQKSEHRDVLVDKNSVAIGVKELPDGSDINLQLPIFKGPSFVVSQQEESNLTYIESSIKEKPPDQQSEVLGWKLQMPIIKMPKLPKLYRKSVRSESEEPLDPANVYMYKKDSSVDIHGQIAPHANVNEDQSVDIKGHKVGIRKLRSKMSVPTVEGQFEVDESIPFSVQMGSRKDKTVSTNAEQNVLVTHANVLTVEKLNIPTANLQKGDLDTHKPEALDDFVQKSAVDISSKLILSADELTEVQDKDGIDVVLEYKIKDAEDEHKESHLRMPRFKLPSFGSLTKRASYNTDGKMEVKEDHWDIKDEDSKLKILDVKDSDYKDIHTDNIQTIENKTKIKLPKVGVSLPKRRGHRGHYTVGTHIQYANNELEYEKFQITTEDFERESKRNILDTDEQDISKDIATDITNVQTEKGKITLPYFHMPKLGLAKLGDADLEETNNIISDTTENVGYDDISEIPAVDTFPEEPRGNKDSKNWKIQMPFIKIPKLGTSEKMTVDTSTRDQVPDGIDGKEVATETNVSSEISDVTQKVDGHFKIPIFKIPPFSLTGPKTKGSQYEPKEDNTAEVEISSTNKAASDSREFPESDTQEVSKKTELTSEDSDIEKYGSPFKLPSVKLPSFSMSGLRGRLSRDETDMEKLHPVLEQTDNDNNLKDLKITKSKKKKKIKTKKGKDDSQIENQEDSDTKTENQSIPTSAGLDETLDKEKSGFHLIKKQHVKAKMPKLELYELYTTEEKPDLKDIDDIPTLKLDSDLKDEAVKADNRETREFKEKILTTYISADLPEIQDRNIYSDNIDIKQKKIEVKTLVGQPENETKTISIEQNPKTTKTTKSKKKSRKVSHSKKSDIQMAKKQEETDSSGETQSDDVIVGDSPDEDRSVTEEEYKYSEGSKSKGYLAKIKMPKLELVRTSKKSKQAVKHPEGVDVEQTKEVPEPAYGHILDPQKFEDLFMEAIIDLTDSKDYHATGDENTEEFSNKIEFPNYQMQTISLKTIENTEEQTGRIFDQEKQMIYSSSLDASGETSGDQETLQMDFTQDYAEKKDKTSTIWKFQLPSIKRPTFGRKGDKNKMGETLTDISLETSKAGTSFQKTYDNILISKKIKSKESSEELEDMTLAFQKHMTQADYPTTDDNVLIEEHKTGKKTHMPKMKLPKLEFSTVFTKESKAKMSINTIQDNAVNEGQNSDLTMVGLCMEKEETEHGASEHMFPPIDAGVVNTKTTLITTETAKEGQHVETVLSNAKDSTKQAVGEMNNVISSLSAFTDFENGELARETNLVEKTDQTKSVFLKSTKEVTYGEKIKSRIKTHDTERGYYLTMAENDLKAEKIKNEKVCPQIQLTVTTSEKEGLSRLETTTVHDKTEEVIPDGSIKVISAVVEEEEVSSGLKLATLKFPLFSAAEVTTESSVDEPREAAPETIAETTLEKSRKEMSTVKPEKTAYEADKEEPKDKVDMADKEAEISLSEGKVKTPEAEKESEGWKLPSFRLPTFSLFGTSELKAEDASKEISTEPARKTTTETEVVTEARTTISDTSETAKSLPKSEERVQITKTIVESVVVEGQDRSIEEMESAWKVSLSSFQIPVLSKEEQILSISSKTISFMDDIDRREIVTDILTAEGKEEVELMHLESALEAPSTEEAKSDITGRDTDKELKVEVQEFVTEVDVDKESPTDGMKVKGKVRKHKKKITKVEKTITTVQTAGVEAISPTLEFHLTSPEIKTVEEEGEVKEVSPQTRVTVSVYEEQVKVSTPEPETITVEVAVKTEEGVEKEESVQEVSTVLTEVTSAVVEEEEVSFGWKLPPFKIPLFSATEVTTESSVDEPREAAPETIAETTLEKSTEEMSTVTTEKTAYEADKEEPIDEVDTADKKAEISLSEGEVKTPEAETESEGWKLPSFRLPTFSLFGTSELKAEDALKEISTEPARKTTTETEVVTEARTTIGDTSETAKSLPKSEERVQITKTIMESVVVEGQDRSIEEMESAWKVSLSSFQIPVLSKEEQSLSIASKTISFMDDIDRREIVTDILTAEGKEEVEPMHLESAFEAPSTEGAKSDITGAVVEKVYTEEVKSEASEESPIPKERDTDKELKVEVQEFVTEVDVDKESPTDGMKVKGKVRKHKKKITKVEKTITTVQTAGVEAISPTLEFHLTSPEIKTVEEEGEVKEVSPQTQVTVSVYEEQVKVSTPEPETITVEVAVKTEEGVEKEESVQEVSTVLTEVTSAVVEEEEVSFGWKLPPFKIPLFSATEVTTESSVDEPREAAPETIAETTLEKSTEEMSTVTTEKTAYEADKEEPIDEVDTEDKKAEISLSEGGVKTPEAETESEGWKLPSFRLPTFSLFGTSELKAEDALKEISTEPARKTTTETEVVTEARTTIGDTSETAKSLPKSEERVQITKTIVESVVVEGQDRSIEEMESAWKVSLSSFQIPVLIKEEQSLSIASKTISFIDDIERREIVTDILTAEGREEVEPVHLESTFEAPSTEGVESEITGAVVDKVYTEEEKSEASEESPIPKERDTDKELKVEVQEIVTEEVDVDKESPTEGMKVKGKVRKHKKKITKVEKTITTVQTAGVEAVSPTLEFHLTTPEIKTVAEEGEVKEVSPQTQVTVSVYEEQVKVSTPEPETITVEVAVKTEEGVEKEEAVQEVSTVFSKVTSAVVEEEEVSSGWKLPTFKIPLFGATEVRTESSVDEPREAAPETIAETILEKSTEEMSSVKTEKTAYEADKEEPKDKVDMADKKAEISLSEGKVKTPEAETESEGRTLPSFRLPTFSLFGTSEMKAEDALKEISTEPARKTTTETEVVTEARTTIGDTSETDESFPKSEESVHITKTIVESVVVEGQERSIEEMESAWKVSLSSFQIPVLSKEEQSLSIAFKTISFIDDIDRREIVTDILTAEGKEEVEPVQLESSFEAPTTEESKSDITGAVVEKVYTEEVKSEASEESPIPKERDTDKELKIEVQETVTEAIYLDKESPTDGVKVKGKVRKHKKKITKVEKTITTVQTASVESISTPLEFHLTTPEIKNVEKEGEVKEVSPQTQVTVSIYKEQVTVSTPEPETITVEVAVKTEEGVEKEEAIQEVSTVFTEVTSAVVEQEEVSSGWKLPTFKIPLFSATEVSTESSVDEPSEAAPETIAETTLEKSTVEMSTVKNKKTAYEADKEEPKDMVDTADKKAETSVSEGEVKTPEAETESEGWKLPSFRLPTFSLFGTSEMKAEDASKEISIEPARKTTTETEVVSEARTTIGDTSETAKSSPKSEERVQITKTIVESVVVEGQDRSIEEMESAWKVSLSSFQIPVLSEAEQSDSVAFKTISFIDSTDRREIVTDSSETKLIVANKEENLQVSSLEYETNILDISVKCEDDLQSQCQQETSVMSTENSMPVKISMEKLEADEIVTDPELKTETLESVLEMDSTEQMDNKEKSRFSEGEKISSKSAMISKAKLGVSIVAESINISSEDTKVTNLQTFEKDPVSDRKLKSLREGKLKFYSTDIAPSHHESTADLHASNLSVSERRRRIIFPQLSLPSFGVTVLHESISISDEDSPTTNISFTDKIHRSPKAVNISLSQKEEGAADTSTLHMTMVSDAKEAKQDGNIEHQLNKDIMKTIESINLKVQQLKLVDEEYEYPEKVSPEFQISKLSFDNSITKTRLVTDGIHEHNLLSQGITDQVLSADESEVTLEMSDVIHTQTSKSEESLYALTSFSGLSDTKALSEYTESTHSDSLHASSVAQSPVTESTRIHFPQFSTPKLSVAVMGESIHIEDDESTKAKLDYFLLEENVQRQLSTEKEVIKTAGEASESPGWKFQMPSFKMNIFGKTDKTSDTSLDSGRSANEKADSALQDDAENHKLKADHEKQPPVEEKLRSPFKLPSFKLPSLSLRGKKEKMSESLSIDLPDTDEVASQEELPTEIERNKDTGKLKDATESRIEGETVKAGLLSTKEEQAKIKLPKLDFSKPSMKVSKGSTNLAAECLDANISEVIESKDGEVEVQDDTSGASPGSPGVQKIEKSEIHVQIIHELAEEVRIEFPYFKTPLISAIIPQDVTSETADSHQDSHDEVHTTEIKDEHAISKVYKTPLRKTEAIDMSGYIPEAENPEFVSEELKDISISSQQDVSGSKIRPTRKAIKISFSKVKMPILTLSAPREKESFDITSRHDGPGLDLPEYDLSSKDELPAVDITCVANQSVQDITEALESSDTANVERSETDQIRPHQEGATAIEKEETSENAEPQHVSILESVSLKEHEKVIQNIIQTETATADSSTSISKSQPVDGHETIKLSHISYIRFGAPSPEATKESMGKSDIELYSDSSSGDIHSEYDNVSPDAIKPKSKSIKSSSFTSGIVKEYDISTSEMPAYGFSLFKVKLPEVSTSITTKDLENQNIDDGYQNKPGLSVEMNTEASQSPETRLEKSKDELIRSELSVSPEVHIEKLMTFAFEMKSPTHTTAISFPIHAKDLEVAHPETTEQLAPNNQEEQITIKEKEAIPKSPSKFRLWIPNIGFSSSLDQGESKKVDHEEQKTEVSKPEKESLPSSKEKVPWYKFPKLGFSSTEKQKSDDKETVKKPEASTITEPENIEIQTSSVVQSAQASLAEPEDFMVCCTSPINFNGCRTVDNQQSLATSFPPASDWTLTEQQQTYDIITIHTPPVNRYA
ncbi:PREDICTED: protein AHNAK2 [Nanorana parkeri]|uniref:protein AHNAK2 n=1 Tax=Nanorana parkeri TaxID=125878 RepID=UPI0008544AAA|nr:PREDICTED: protein AHNAK2 [Nanorana parkeri]